MDIPAPSPLIVAVLLFDDVVLVDVTGPIDVFLHANSLVPNAYRVVTVGKSTAPVRSEAGAVTMVPAFGVDTCPAPDIIVVPGHVAPDFRIGAGPELARWIAAHAAAGVTVLSVCVGFFTLAPLGLLDGRRATTHWKCLIQAQDAYPQITLVRNVRYVDDGQFITTGGVTDGIDGALQLVARHLGDPIATQVADLLVYTKDAPLPPGTILPDGNRTNTA